MTARADASPDLATLEAVRHIRQRLAAVHPETVAVMVDCVHLRTLLALAGAPPDGGTTA